MFGINNVDQVKQIVEGHVKEITNKENDLYAYRIKICNTCPLKDTRSYGDVCSAKKCVDKNTLEYVKGPGKNIVCGCGCRLSAALRIARKKCVLGKW